MKKKILITGGAGFIGSHLIRSLNPNNYQIYVVDNLSTGYRSNLLRNVNFLKIDCSNPLILKKLNNIDFDCIYHLAGQSSGEYSFYYPFEDFSSNLHGTINIIKLCLNTSKKRLIFTSSMSVYGNYLKAASEKDDCNPKSFYGLSKLSCENYIKFFTKKKLNYTILRLFNIYGPGQNFENKLQGMVSIYLEDALKNNKIFVKGSKNRYRDFVYISDVIKILKKSKTNKNCINNTLNVGTGVKTKVSELIKIISKNLNLKKDSIKFYKNTPDDTFGIFSNEKKIKKILNIYKFISLEEGIKKTIKFEKIKHLSE